MILGSGARSPAPIIIHDRRARRSRVRVRRIADPIGAGSAAWSRCAPRCGSDLAPRRRRTAMVPPEGLREGERFREAELLRNPGAGHAGGEQAQCFVHAAPAQVVREAASSGAAEAARGGGSGGRRARARGRALPWDRTQASSMRVRARRTRRPPAAAVSGWTTRRRSTASSPSSACATACMASGWLVCALSSRLSNQAASAAVSVATPTASGASARRCASSSGPLAFTITQSMRRATLRVRRRPIGRIASCARRAGEGAAVVLDPQQTGAHMDQRAIGWRRAGGAAARLPALARDAQHADGRAGHRTESHLALGDDERRHEALALGDAHAP